MHSTISTDAGLVPRISAVPPSHGGTLLERKHYTCGCVVLFNGHNNNHTNHTDITKTTENANAVAVKHNKREKERLRQAAVTRNKTILQLGRKARWEDILFIHVNEKEDFDNINYATLFCELAKARNMSNKLRHGPLFISLITDIYNKIDKRGIEWLGPQSCANIVHAIAKANMTDEYSQTLMSSIIDKSRNWILRGKPQHAANTMWACAKMNYDAPDMFAFVEKNARWLMGSGNSQDMANTVWACAKIDFQAPHLIAEMDQNARRLVEEGTPQNVSNALWACATLGIDAPNLFYEMDQRASWLVEEGTTQTVSNTVWACSMLRYDALNLFSIVTKNPKYAKFMDIHRKVDRRRWDRA